MISHYIHKKTLALINHKRKMSLFYGHLSLNTKEEVNGEDEIFKSYWSQRGLKAQGSNQTTKYMRLPEASVVCVKHT